METSAPVVPVCRRPHRSGGVFLQLNVKDAGWPFDATLIGLGVGVMLISLIGGCGSHNESTCLLRTYTFSLGLLITVTMALTLYLWISNGKDVRQWIEQGDNFQLVQENVYKMTKDQFYAQVDAHQARHPAPPSMHP